MNGVKKQHIKVLSNFTNNKAIFNIIFFISNPSIKLQKNIYALILKPCSVGIIMTVNAANINKIM